MMKFILYLSEMNINEWYLWLLLLLLMLFFLSCCVIRSSYYYFFFPIYVYYCHPCSVGQSTQQEILPIQRYLFLFLLYLEYFASFLCCLEKKFHTLCHILLNIPQHQIWPTISYWIAMTFVAFYFLYNFSPVSGIFSVFFSIFYIPCV